MAPHLLPVLDLLPLPAQLQLPAQLLHPEVPHLDLLLHSNLDPDPLQLLNPDLPPVSENPDRLLDLIVLDHPHPDPALEGHTHHLHQVMDFLLPLHPDLDLVPLPVLDLDLIVLGHHLPLHPVLDLVLIVLDHPHPGPAVLEGHTQECRPLLLGSHRGQILLGILGSLHLLNENKLKCVKGNWIL